MSRPTPPRWATRTEAAEYASVGLTTLDKWLSQKKLTRYGVGHMVRIDLDEIDALYRANATGRKAS